MTMIPFSLSNSCDKQLLLKLVLFKSAVVNKLYPTVLKEQKCSGQLKLLLVNLNGEVLKDRKKTKVVPIL